MNQKKICFIACVNDELYYKEMTNYINSLILPDEFDLEFYPIRNAKGMCAGYNEAMNSSDAKYKVYIHQDTFIMNPNFIVNVIDLFKKYPHLGLLGMVGADNLSTSPIWWENKRCWGMLYDTRTNVFDYFVHATFDEDYKSVEVVDGLILITQYDLPWRQDIFDGWHCYDISQCQEFKKHGYDIGIPNQKTPWCFHDCGITNLDHYDEYLQRFVKTYLINK